MKRTIKSIYGATLLEIMLVLAIAAMIIVMSVRYYQSAQMSSQANAFVAQVRVLNLQKKSVSGTGTMQSNPGSQCCQLPVLNIPRGGTIAFTANATGFKLEYLHRQALALVTSKSKVDYLTAIPMDSNPITCATVTYVANP